MQQTQQTVRETMQAIPPRPAYLPLNELRRVFKRNSAGKPFAEKLGISRTFLSMMLNGKTNSERVMEAAQAYAQELLARESAAEAEKQKT